MSRVAQRGGVASSKRGAEDGEICPVCKSSRYLNPNMRFLVNPECYHKMCESCVDRIFSHGPAPCPIAGCKKTLRKAKFRSQTFEDLKVEREVDIRRTVAKVFTKLEEDFETLRDYNDYLETVESITFNLIYKIDVEETKKRLEAYTAANRNDSSQSSRRIRETNGEEDTGRVVLKKSLGQRQSAQDTAQSTPEPATEQENGDVGFTFKGLKKKAAPKPEARYDPYGGWSVTPSYYILQDSYEADWLNKSRDNIDHIAGGADIRDFYTRALCDAFSGFGVFVEEEKFSISSSVDAATATADAAAAATGKDVNMDDVF